MPGFLERRLRKEASDKGMSGREAAHYVYGAMNNLGAMHGNEETAKGEEMQRKHDEKRGISATRRNG